MGESKKNRRGGKREGAGRKTKFTFKEKLWIWNRYKRLQERVERYNMKCRLYQEYHGTELEKLEQQIHQFPENMRHKKTGKLCRQIIIEYGEILLSMSKINEDYSPEPPDGWHDEFPIKLLNAIVAYRDYQLVIGKKRQYFPRIRINGEAKLIRQKIAARASQSFGVTVTTGDVQHIMDDRKQEIRSVLEEYV